MSVNFRYLGQDYTSTLANYKFCKVRNLLTRLIANSTPRLTQSKPVYFTIYKTKDDWGTCYSNNKKYYRAYADTKLYQTKLTRQECVYLASLIKPEMDELDFYYIAKEEIQNFPQIS